MSGAVTLHHGDNRDSLRRLIDQGVRVHSVVTDPPYGLVSTVKRFGKDGSAPARSNGPTGAFKRASAGFMGSKWDGTGIERDPEFWALIYDILLPGGYVLAFSSPRTGHWQACAMEMAGFVMHPFFGWVYGSGFPKAHNASRAVDKAMGVEGSFGEPKSAAHAGWIERGRMRGEAGEAENHEGWQRPWMEDEEAVSNAARRYVPGSPEAAQWEGWAYGAQSMKPALEPIYFGQKPFSEKNGALNLLEHGVGAVNIDGCRVPTTDNLNGGTYSAGGNKSGLPGDTRDTKGAGMFAEGAGRIPGGYVQPPGRHPANLLHDGSDDVLAMFPAKAGASAPVKGSEPSSVTNGIYGEFAQRLPGVFHGDTGSAARFFNSFPTTLCPDCNDTGLSVEGEPGALYQGACATCGGESARLIDAEPLRYHSKATKADRAGSKHPTVKPINLMRWLCRLVTPPGGTVLDPFGGSGTTGEAARLEGFDCILMEAEDQFAADIRRRFGMQDPDPLASMFG